MASWTLKTKYEAKDDSISHSRSILCHAKYDKEIYYQFEDEPDAPTTDDASSEALTLSTPTSPVSSHPLAPVASPQTAGAIMNIEDVPIKATSCHHSLSPSILSCQTRNEMFAKLFSLNVLGK
jgi:hypothetical protein